MSEPGASIGSLFQGSPPRSKRRRTWYRMLAYRLAAPVLSTLARLLWASWRIHVIEAPPDLDERLAERRPLIPCAWHQQLIATASYIRRLQGSGLRPCWLISPSLDGELATRIARRWQVHVVRGSATRTGVKALRELHRAVRREGVSPVTFPDGPSGPERKFKAGTVMLSQLSQAPILPVACAARRALHLRSWDRLAIPWPFTRVVIAVGAPREIPRDLPTSELEAVRLSIEHSLEDLEQRARAALDRKPNRGATRCSP